MDKMLYKFKDITDKYKQKRSKKSSSGLIILGAIVIILGLFLVSEELFYKIGIYNPLFNILRYIGFFVLITTGVSSEFIGVGALINNKFEKVLNGDGRVLVRSSGTENLIRVMIEGKDVDLITSMCEDLVSLIEKELSNDKIKKKIKRA